jgi:RNA polymerase sigma factor (sigma-70 family)
MNRIALKDQSVLEYQTTGDSTKLVNQYKNFLNKYCTLFYSNTIDFRNYDIRCFLACYIEDKKLSNSLRRGKYHSSKTVAAAYKVLHYLRLKLRNHTYQELEHELLIPFLQCAKSYQPQGIGFAKYLYNSYRYELKRHLDRNIKLDAMDRHEILYRDIWVEDEWEEEELPEHLTIEMDEHFELSDPNWIHGKKAGEPFSNLKPHERYILVKYYYEEYTDKEIARMLPYNPKSIHRIRMRLIKYFKELYDKGELKCIRL